MYPVELTKPIVEELINNGLSELKTTEDVTDNLDNSSGKCLVLINSVCGCAAGAARPGVLEALNKASTKPNHLYTVFAGVDFDAVNKVREMCLPYPPSSPAIALFDNGELIHFVERHHIEGRNANMIADHLIDGFNEHCN